MACAALLLVQLDTSAALRIKPVPGFAKAGDEKQQPEEPNRSVPDPTLPTSSVLSGPQTGIAKVLADSKASAQADNERALAEFWENLGHTTSDCPNRCRGVNGRCILGQCICYRGWQGKDCAAHGKNMPPASALMIDVPENQLLSLCV